ncbi:ATP synthase F0 subunit B [Syntrophobacter fumaroxidans]|uniref:ATP synthase subunit b n=1 Tax=Syntrophobacter fumaroxidans (strain DSM 10017 / MPOB) TaxID=335543 RepID=A0LLG3_SYNFM|nr:ATP synthase F0 subunit B [Syntrophobacter fumaroxidans]ABK18265.1 transcriptional regulator, Fis family [Syntrophobacter fumaroxidans MPOB]
MISINVTLIIQLVTFLIFVFLMNLVLYRPIRRIVAQRKQFVDDRQTGIDRLEADAQKSVQEFNARLLDARKEGRQKIQDLKAAAYEREKELLQQATEQAAGRMQTMRAKVQSDIGQAREQLMTQVRSFSVELAQKILGRSI